MAQKSPFIISDSEHCLSAFSARTSLPVNVKELRLELNGWRNQMLLFDQDPRNLRLSDLSDYAISRKIKPDSEMVQSFLECVKSAKKVRTHANKDGTSGLSVSSTALPTFDLLNRRAKEYMDWCNGDKPGDPTVFCLSGANAKYWSDLYLFSRSPLWTYTAAPGHHVSEELSTVHPGWSGSDDAIKLNADPILWFEQILLESGFDPSLAMSFDWVESTSVHGPSIPDSDNTKSVIAIGVYAQASQGKCLTILGPLAAHGNWRPRWTFPTPKGESITYIFGAAFGAQTGAAQMLGNTMTKGIDGTISVGSSPYDMNLTNSKGTRMGCLVQYHHPDGYFLANSSSADVLRYVPASYSLESTKLLLQSLIGTRNSYAGDALINPPTLSGFTDLAPVAIDEDEAIHPNLRQIWIDSGTTMDLVGDHAGTYESANFRLALPKGFLDISVPATPVNVSEMGGITVVELNPMFLGLRTTVTPLREHIQAELNRPGLSLANKTKYERALSDSSDLADAIINTTVYAGGVAVPTREQLADTKLFKDMKKAGKDLFSEKIADDKTVEDAVKKFIKDRTKSSSYYAFMHTIDEALDPVEIVHPGIISGLNSPWVIVSTFDSLLETYKHSATHNGSTVLVNETDVSFLISRASTFGDSSELDRTSFLSTYQLDETYIPDLSDIDDEIVKRTPVGATSFGARKVSAYELNPSSFTTPDGYPVASYPDTDSQVRAVLAFKGFGGDATNVIMGMFFTNQMDISNG